MQHRRQLFLAAAATLAAPAILHAQIAATVQSGSIADALAADGRFSSFIELLQKGGTLTALRGAGNFTLFAPIDSGIDAIPLSIRDRFTPTQTGNDPSAGADQVALGAFNSLHIVDGVYPIASFQAANTTLRTRNTTMLNVQRTPESTLLVTLADNAGPGTGGFAMPRPARVLVPVITAANGIILPIDNALLK